MDPTVLLCSSASLGKGKRKERSGAKCEQALAAGDGEIDSQALGASVHHSLRRLCRSLLLAVSECLQGKEMKENSIALLRNRAVSFPRILISHNLQLMQTFNAAKCTGQGRKYAEHTVKVEDERKGRTNEQSERKSLCVEGADLLPLLYFMRLF